MSEFQTGDRIVIAESWYDTPRFFLAEFKGRVYFAAGENGDDSAGWVLPHRVSAYAPPCPFKVGDRLRRKNPQSPVFARREYVVMHASADDFRVAYYENEYGGIYPAVATEFELVASPDVASPKAWTAPDGTSYRLDRTYRDRDGDTWQFTGQVDEHGVPFMGTKDDPGGDELVTWAERQWGPLKVVA